MPYQKIKCPYGHTFRAYLSRPKQKVTCPDCMRARDNDSPTVNAPVTTDFVVDVSFGSLVETTPQSESFSSGGGGDYGGGGASGSWGDSSSDSSSSSSSDSGSSDSSSSSSD